MVSVIVLAAGLSTRMGKQNKLLLPLRSKTMIETTLENIIASSPLEIIVITGHETEKIKPVIDKLPITIIYNANYAGGMTTSIQQGIEHATGKGYMICLGDMYAISAAEYSYLQKQFEEAYQKDEQCICIPMHEGKKGNPVIFSAYYKNDILQHNEMEGCKSIVQANRQHLHEINMKTSAVLQDVDYPHDYEKLISGEG